MSKKISLYVFSYSKRYYLTHPWKWFHDLKVGIKNFIHRGKYGYAWVDLWNMNSYLGELMPNMLDELANRSYGWPGGFPDTEWPEMEDWQKELHILASLMRTASRDCICDTDKFEQEFSDWRSGYTFNPLRHLKFYGEYVIPKEKADAIDAAKKEWERINLEHEAIHTCVFNRLTKIWNTLWD